MARLYEYQGKQLLKIAKVPTPDGEVAATPQEAKKIAEKIGKPLLSSHRSGPGAAVKQEESSSLNILSMQRSLLISF